MIHHAFDEIKVLRQIERERTSLAQGKLHYAQRCLKASDKSQLKPEQKIMFNNIGVLSEALESFYAAHAGNKAYSHEWRNKVKDLFEVVSFDQVAFITLRHSLNIMIQSDKRRNLARISIPLVDAILRQYVFAKFEQEYPKYVKAIMDSLKTEHEGHKHRALTYLRHKKGISDPEWSDREKLLVGNQIINVMIESTGLFSLETVFQDGQTGTILCPNPELLDNLEKMHEYCSDIMAVEVPTIVPPRPWTGMYGGGFFLNTERTKQYKLVKIRDKEIRDEVAEHPPAILLDALNSIQGVAWRINPALYNILVELRALDSDLGGIPVRPIGERLADFNAQHPMPDRESPDFYTWRTQRAAVYDAYYREASARTAFNIQLATAKEFLSEPALFFCYNVDWRGRIYSLQNCGLHPQGDDVSRALLTFAEGKPLGERGLYWLRVHLANCFGYDKDTFDGRVAWTKEHEAAILECGSAPLLFKWWAGADKPFMFLAACIEYYNALDSGHPLTYPSSLPIAMDASCSGSQHFSALLRDPVGAQAVNLTPGDKPSDIYTLVANQSIEILKGMPDDERAQRWLKAGVDRKWTKRNTMTMPYSAGLYGFSNQITDELRKNRGYLGPDVVNGREEFRYGQFLAAVNREAISRVVVKMFEAMRWLQVVARAVAKKNRDIRWTSPAGLRIVQRYRKMTARAVDCWFGGCRFQPKLRVETEKVDSMGHTNGISPNFIHSLDASHLCLIVRELKKRGVNSCAVIHDSFGTHAADTDCLRDVVRETFVEMYQTNWLEVLYESIKVNNPDIADELPSPPKQGEFDLESVKDSPYFVS